MANRIWMILLACTALWGTSTSPLAHEYHLSFGEADFNAETQRLEVALCVVPEDLELALRAREKRRVTLEREPEVDSLVAGYIADVFVVRSADGKYRSPDWVGMEVGLKEAWLFFEVPLPGGVMGAQIAHRALLETSAKQWNQLRLTQPGFRRTLSFRHGRDTLEISTAGVRTLPKGLEPPRPRAGEGRRRAKS